MSDKEKEVLVHPTQYSNGITLRDYFAGQAVVGVLSEVGVHDEVGQAYLKQHAAKHIAESSYILADAMLAARKS